ncbi:MAG: hypothetical protein IJ551_07670, partial [Prevotella sp.]|nr:hypothetical protein [Prevotella sp.]
SSALCLFLRFFVSSCSVKIHPNAWGLQKAAGFVQKAPPFFQKGPGFEKKAAGFEKKAAGFENLELIVMEKIWRNGEKVVPLQPHLKMCPFL